MGDRTPPLVERLASGARHRRVQSRPLAINTTRMMTTSVRVPLGA
jgi:hypothetical protein